MHVCRQTHRILSSLKSVEPENDRPDANFPATAAAQLGSQTSHPSRLHYSAKSAIAQGELPSATPADDATICHALGPVNVRRVGLTNAVIQVILRRSKLIGCVKETFLSLD